MKQQEVNRNGSLVKQGDKAQALLGFFNQEKGRVVEQHDVDAIMDVVKPKMSDYWYDYWSDRVSQNDIEELWQWIEDGLYDIELD